MSRKPKDFEDLSPTTRSKFPKKELKKHIDAYHYWKNLPVEQRTYKKVAEFVGVGAGSIQLWHRAFNWDDRLSEYEDMVTDEVISSKRDVIKQIRELTIDAVKEVIEMGGYEDGADLKNYIDAGQRAIGMGRQLGESAPGSKQVGPIGGGIRIGRAVLIVEK